MLIRAASLAAQTPNLEGKTQRPLRYGADGPDFVIENGEEFFNRSLYGGNTAFRVDGGDKPEFVMYLPGRGGILRLPGGSATVLELPLDPGKALKSLTVRTLCNDVVIGLMSVTLERR